MESLFQNPAFTTFDKFKNILFAWFICFTWMFFLTFLFSLLENYTPHLLKPVNLPYYLFFGCFLAPLWEELAFRYIPIRIATIINPKLIFPVILLASLIFGWGHGYGPVSLLRQGVTGFILSWVYIKNNNSYWSSTILHCLWNLTCLFIPM